MDNTSFLLGFALRAFAFVPFLLLTLSAMPEDPTIVTSSSSKGESSESTIFSTSCGASSRANCFSGLVGFAKARGYRARASTSLLFTETDGEPTP